LKVKFKPDKREPAWERKLTDVKAPQLNKQVGYLFDWLVKGGYVTANHYKVVIVCGVCGRNLKMKQWSQYTINGAFVCKTCNEYIKKIRRTGKARPSKRLTKLIKMGAVKFKKELK